MSSITVSLIVFACVFGGAVLGIFLHAVLPPHHLSNESKDIVKLGMGLVGTMAALVLGLLVASAKGSYDAQSAELTEMSANIAMLDRVLAHYGTETKDTRDLLRGVVVRSLDGMWSKDRTSSSPMAPASAAGESLYDKIQGLSPKNDAQRAFQGQAFSMAISLGQTRWLMYEQGGDLGFHAVGSRAGSLAHGYFHQFRPLRSFQRNRDRQLVRLRAGGFRRNLLDPGDVRALRRTDCDLQRPAARRPCPVRPVARNSKRFQMIKKRKQCGMMSSRDKRGTRDESRVMRNE
jgi:hypothetical protein